MQIFRSSLHQSTREKNSEIISFIFVSLVTWWITWWYFDETFIIVYLVSVFPFSLYISFKYRSNIGHSLITSQNKSKNRLILIIVLATSIASFSLLIYSKTISVFDTHYIIGNELINLKYKNIPADDIPTLFGRFEGEKSITEIWSAEGVILNRIAIIVTHLLIVHSVYFLNLMMRPNQKNVQLRVLFVASNNPRRSLDLEYEQREVEDALLVQSACREFIDLKVVSAARAEDLAGLISAKRYDILHFSGHGTTDGIEIRSENPLENIFVDYKILREVLTKIHPKLIVLNSCSSLNGVKIFSEFVENVVGTLKVVEDEHAIFFSKKFYKFIGDGNSVISSFDQTEHLMRIRYQNLNNDSEFSRSIGGSNRWPNKQENVFFLLSKKDAIFTKRMPVK